MDRYSYDTGGTVVACLLLPIQVAATTTAAFGPSGFGIDWLAFIRIAGLPGVAFQPKPLGIASTMRAAFRGSAVPLRVMPPCG
ncbi:hypothetical protein GCM10027277_58030 [Pseudoduganella ginsengisoli]